MTGSNFDFDMIEHDLVAAHKASGKPRYSVRLCFAGGGFMRRWTNDREEALVHHAAAVADPLMDMVITFDHWLEEREVVDIAPGKTPAQRKAESDAEIDAMIDRFLAQCGV